MIVIIIFLIKLCDWKANCSISYYFFKFLLNFQCAFHWIKLYIYIFFIICFFDQLKYKKLCFPSTKFSFTFFIYVTHFAYYYRKCCGHYFLQNNYYQFIYIYNSAWWRALILLNVKKLKVLSKLQCYALIILLKF